MPKLINAESIFDSNAQLLEIDPQSIRLLEDRVLIRDLGDSMEKTELTIPQTAQPRNGSLRFGEIVAIGAGDRFKELGMHKVLKYVRRRKVTTESGRLPMETRPGDIVVYTRRKDEEFVINGERLTLCHEEQAVLMILDRSEVAA